MPALSAVEVAQLDPSTAPGFAQEDKTVEHVSLDLSSHPAPFQLSSGQIPARNLEPPKHSMAPIDIHLLRREQREDSDHEISLILENRMEVPTNSSEEPELERG